jgi:hypothetical protein
MNTSGESRPNDLAEWLRRVIIAIGYVTGACWLVHASLGSSISLIDAGRRGIPIGPRIFAFWWDFAWVSAAVLLLIGTWGSQRHRRWGRPLLFASAALMIATILTNHVISMIGWMLLNYSPGLVGLRRAASIAGDLNMAVYQSVFPVILILCLRRPELADTFPDPHRGFPPLFEPEMPTPALPVAPAAENRSLD